MEVDTVARALLGAAAAATGNGTHGDDGAHADDCFCIAHINHGTDFEQKFSVGCQWTAFVVSIGILAFYAWHSWKYTCGWEEVYVCIIECKPPARQHDHNAPPLRRAPNPRAPRSQSSRSTSRFSTSSATLPP